MGQGALSPKNMCRGIATIQELWELSELSSDTFDVWWGALGTCSQGLFSHVEAIFNP